MEPHKRVLGILYITAGCLQIAGMIFASMLISALMPFIFDSADIDSQWVFVWIVPFIKIIATFVILFFAVPSVVGGIAMLNGKAWALTLLLVLGCFKLFSFPFGTALGIYTIWVYAEEHKKS